MYLTYRRQEHEYLVHFILATSYADPSHLGWDPTMKPLADGHNFDITVQSDDGKCAVYRTLDMLSDAGAYMPLSRGTRVWKAVLVEDGKEVGSPVALKDAWVHPDGLSEGSKFQAVRSAEREAELNEFLDVCFLTVVTHGDVFLDQAREKRDCTIRYLRKATPSEPLDPAKSLKSTLR